MVTLLFGLPGTGKTTFSQAKRGITWDFGSIESWSEKFKSKVRSQLTKTLEIIAQSHEQIYIDTYWQMLDMDTVFELVNKDKVKIYLAIPDESHKHGVLARVANREGCGAFALTYAYKFDCWANDWRDYWFSRLRYVDKFVNEFSEIGED